MTILFDIGRVLLDFEFEPSLARLLPAGTGNAEERLARLLERKDDFEAGKLEVNEYVEWALRTLDSEASEEEFHHAWRNIFTPNEPMWERVEQLAADGHRLILFSNINGIHSPWVFEEFPRFSLFHGAVLSFETGFIKPQPEIYRHAIGKYDLEPERTLYVDDMAANVEAGKKAGFLSWQYDLKDHAAFESWLAEHLEK